MRENRPKQTPAPDTATSPPIAVPKKPATDSVQETMAQLKNDWKGWQVYICFEPMDGKQYEVWFAYDGITEAEEIAINAGRVIVKNGVFDGDTINGTLKVLDGKGTVRHNLTRTYQFKKNNYG